MEKGMEKADEDVDVEDNDNKGAVLILIPLQTAISLC
jgi:hypothetical protein